MAAKFPQRKIGDDHVSAIGLGCMGMSFGYTRAEGWNDEESLQVLTKAADLGITFWVSERQCLYDHVNTKVSQWMPGHE